MSLVVIEVIFSVSLMRSSNVTETKKKSAEIVVAGCCNSRHSWTRVLSQMKRKCRVFATVLSICLIICVNRGKLRIK